MMMFIRPIVYFFLVSLLPLFVVAEWLPLRVSVDNIVIGDLNAELSKKGHPVAIKGSELLQKIGDYLQADKISRIKKFIDSADSLLLQNLTLVGITSSYTEKELKLILIIPLEMRVVKDFPVVIARNKTGLALYNDNYSGYLNLRGVLGHSDTSSPTLNTYEQAPVSGQFELVQNLNYFTLESTAQYREFEKKPFQRNDTSLVHDFEDSQTRLRIGDFNTITQGFQSGLSSGGIQYQKQFNIYRDKKSYNQRSTIIQVKNNSLLEVFVNDVLISRLRVNVGPYNLKDIPLLYGLNKVKVVLTDNFGGKEVFNIDMLFDDQILAKGISDFSFQVGKPSFYLDSEKTYSNNNFSSFFYKYGLTNELTLFVNHQNYLSSNLYGLGLGLLTNYGTNFIDIAQYTETAFGSGQAAKWRYNSPELSFENFINFRFFGGAEFRSLNFRTITLESSVPNNFSEKYDFSFQKQLTDNSSVSLGLTKIKGQGFGNDDFSRRLVYQNKFSQNWRFDISYSWSERQSDLDQILLTLNWLEPEGKAQSSFSHNTVDSVSTVHVTKNNKVNFNDLQINVIASKQKARDTAIESQNIDLSANYYATQFESRLQLSGSSGQSNFNRSTQFGFGSAIAWTQGGVAISRPITDSFAIIRAEGLNPNQQLKIPNGLEKDSIKIANNESFIFSNLVSYSERSIQLDSTSLGVSARLDREAYVLNPKYRAGLFVPLKVIKSLAVRGKLASSTKEQVSYAYGKILDSNGYIFSENFFTDESGNFLIDGLSYGKYQIVLSDLRLKKISFEIDKPDDTAKNVEADGDDETDPEASEYELGILKVEKEMGT